ncbi:MULTISPECIES: DUF3854 domain-containing protein [Leptolyngbya]|uniref:DUF3854 domain-containing protein n=1 Tax=Leptolyngbya TaxID=47251 RepID=UPI001687090B|nr:DUF3854 domain-containing protein [Leptolyngbya sp. FACHB-1624]MBD1857444.1 DUF3854 domain-containing protein [Leptolyngbya sp. FACHB-1624]
MVDFFAQSVNSLDSNNSNSTAFRGFGRNSSRYAQTDIGGKTQTLQDWATSDIKSSGISDEMLSLNFQIIEGDAAIEPIIEFAQTKRHNAVRYVDSNARYLLRTYEFARRGGWLTFGCTLNGGTGDIAYFKPRFPRLDFEQRKPVKYETPKGAEGHPILPFVTDEVAEKTYEKYSSRPLEGETYWFWVRRCNIPVVITEGWKKAVKLTQEGYPAISLRGVSMWHYKGTTELFPLIREFAAEGRKITIVFDQDSKTKTVRNVSREIRKFSAALERLGCKVRIAVWHESCGKGIDDATVKMGTDWLHQTMKISLTPTEWKVTGISQQYRNIIQRLKTLSIEPDRDTQGDYLPELPSDIPVGSITLIEANMGAGKSYTGINKLVRQWIESGGNVLRLDPLLSLGAQGAKLSDIPHSSDYDLTTAEGYAMFCRDISARHGAAVCFNSLLKIPQGFLTDRPLLIVLDEVNQGLDYLIQGGTLGSKQPEILDRFSEICFTAGFNGAIVAAEAEIHPRSVELLKKYSGSDDIRYFKHHRHNAVWNVDLGNGRLDGFMLKLLYDAESKKQLILTDSQTVSKKIARRIALQFPEKRIIRIDSETNREGRFIKFFDDPDEFLRTVQPDVLICSPSVKTGVSITQEGAFDGVYGFFVGAIDPDGWMQMLGRYRPSVDRFVCVPKFVLTSGDESLMRPANVKERLERERAAFSNHYAIEALEETDDRKMAVRLAAQDYYSEMVSLRGAQKAVSQEYLTSVLREVGHTVLSVEWGTDKTEASNLSQIQEDIDLEDARRIARSEACESIEDAQKIIASECSLDDEFRARKTIYREAYPGIAFDDDQDCFWLLTKSKGNLGQGAEMQAAIENLEASKELDLDLVSQVCGNELGLTHRLPKRHMKAFLLKQSGILALSVRGSQFQNSDEFCLNIQQWALSFAKELRYYFGFNIAKEYQDSKGRKRHTPIEIVGKLLKKIGLSMFVARKVGTRGNQARIYETCLDRIKQEDQAVAWMYREKAIEAARARLQEKVLCEIPVIERRAVVQPASPSASESAPVIIDVVAISIADDSDTKNQPHLD